MIIRVTSLDEEGHVLGTVAVAEAASTSRRTIFKGKQHISSLVRADIRWNMAFTWQAPMMLMSYSVIAFMTGLIVFVCAPLYDGSAFDGPSKVGTSLYFPCLL